MDIGRRVFVIGGGAAAVVLLGGATTSLDFGAEQRQSLLIAGSEEFLPYAAKLADAFAKAHPSVDVVVEAGGTVPGLLALGRGAIDVALASRELAPTEDDKLTRSHLVARDAIGLVVNPANPLTGLTRKEAFAILHEGKAPLHLYRRKPDAATQKAVDKLVLDHATMAAGAIVVESGAAMREKIAADPDGFGFLALHDVTPAVKVLAIDGVPLSRATILSARYPFTRSFFCVAHGSPEGSAAERFLAFALGREGQSLFESLGLIAVR